jgi:uncharacterized protein (TIGR02246 family)
MLRNTWLIVGLTLAGLAAGCSTASAPPPDTRVADIQAVKDLEASAAKHANARDAEKWASFFAEDASGLFPGASTLNGRAAIKAMIEPLCADPNFSLSLQSTRAIASKGGDMVYSQGTYTMTMTDLKTKKPMTDKGKYLTIFTKQPDGNWKAVADTFNSDSPM